MWIYIAVNRKYSRKAPMEDLENVLRNIDVFCRILVEKIARGEDSVQRAAAEPIEDLLRKRYLVADAEVDSSKGYLIPLPQAEEPLVDVFEDEHSVKVFFQCSCQDKKVQIVTKADAIEICVEECRKLNLPTTHLNFEDIVVKCSNNKVLEIAIPKAEPTCFFAQ